MHAGPREPRANQHQPNRRLVLLVGLVGALLIIVMDWASVTFHFAGVWGAIHWPVTVLLALLLIQLLFHPIRRRKKQ